jgi:hypothetical protein
VAKAADEPREEAAAVTRRLEADDAQILICDDGSNDSERAVEAGAAHARRAGFDAEARARGTV